MTSTANSVARASHAPQQIDTGLGERPLSGTQRPAGQPANDRDRTFGRVGILGAGAIGIGLAQALVEADIPVTLFDQREALDRGLALLRASLAQALASGAMTAERQARCLALFNATPRFHHLKDADLILDVMPADLEARDKFVRWLDEIGKPDAILALHARGARLDAVARLTRRPGDVLGLDFADPGVLAQDVALLQGRQSSAHAAAAVAALLGRIGILGR